MTCQEAMELISLSLDGQLTADQEEQLQAHLEACPSCRALREELSGIQAAWDGLEIQPPAELRERILSNLPSQKTSKVIYWKRWATMAAAVVLVALAAWRIPHLPFGPSNTAEAPDLAAAQTEDAEEAAPAAVVTAADESADAGGTVLYAAKIADEDEADATAVGGAVQASGEAVRQAEPAPKGKEDYAFAQSSSAPISDVAPVSDVAPAAGAVVSAEEPMEDRAVVDIWADNATPTPYRAYFSSRPESAETEDKEPPGVPEPVPETGSAEAYITAEPFEPITEVEDDVRLYCGILTLTEYEPDGDYPAEPFPSGCKYTLPVDEFYALVNALEESGQPYTLRPGLFANTRPGLVIVTGGEE